MKSHSISLLTLVILCGCSSAPNKHQTTADTEEKIRNLEFRLASTERVILGLADHILVNDGEYMVRSGDTGAKIARKFEISLADLVRLNSKVSWNNLTVGQIIRIKTEPNQAPETTILTVTDRAPSSTLRASEDRVSP